jgi:hypothetical protein
VLKHFEFKLRDLENPKLAQTWPKFSLIHLVQSKLISRGGLMEKFRSFFRSLYFMPLIQI